MEGANRNTQQRHGAGSPGASGSARPRQPVAGGRVRRPDSAQPAARPPAPAVKPASTASAPAASTPQALFPTRWVLVPLRLFLGVTFVYAGLQKLTDPQYFNPHAAGYIGRQIQAFAHGSPISGLLLHVALPHAVLYGGLIAYGELAIGLGTLVGLLARPAACFGLLLSLIFFLSASWNVHPYFYGADIVFVVAWLTLGLQPHAGLPNLDQRAAAWLERRWPRWVARHPTTLALLFSVPDVRVAELLRGARPAEPAPLAPGREPARRVPASAATHRRGRHTGRGGMRAPSRREFLVGLGVGVAGTLGLVWLWDALHPAAAAPATGGSGATALPTTGNSATPAGTTAANVIARTGDLPANSSASFTIPSTGDPGVLVHLNDGRFVAFDATCTHAGCPVQYDPTSSDLICPCHGAVFDPAQNAAVLQGPADTPLSAVAVTVQSNGTIVLS